ncbi:MAG: DUF3179 domain-containing protein [Myxococcales bacterium]|nr:DUF3179 domain-containing protein [Myxococcales bacterium]
MAREREPSGAAPSRAPAFDVGRALLERPDWFPRFAFTDEREPLSAARLLAQTLVVVAARGGEQRAFVVKQLVYHHVAEGELGGEPVALAFSAIDHGATGFTPVVEGQRLHLSAGGSHRGAVLLTDDETGSHWDLRSGRAVHGPLAGACMPRFSTRLLTVREALARDEALALSRAPPGLAARLFNQFGMFALRGRGFQPPPWRRTLHELDARLPFMTEGLGVIHGRYARFYPRARIDRDAALIDRWGRARARVQLREDDGLPEAAWQERDRPPPLQLYTRWYAFAFCFPHCPIYGDPASGYL